jgi:hypothetical protein
MDKNEKPRRKMDKNEKPSFDLGKCLSSIKGPNSEYKEWAMEAASQVADAIDKQSAAVVGAIDLATDRIVEAIRGASYNMKG